MNMKSDVWSLGCILSVVFTYLERGGDGVKEYEEARTRSARADGSDRFFLRSRALDHPNVHHPSVIEWHKDLIRRAKERNPREGVVVEHILRFLENWVFQKQADRCKAEEVETQLKTTWINYKEAVENPESPDRPPPRGTPPPNNRLPGRCSRTTASEADPKVEKLLVHETDSFKGCDISPDGELVAFWTDTKIKVYNAPSLREGNGSTYAHFWEVPTESRSCMLTSVSLTGRYLVASTTGSFQFYFFDWELHGLKKPKEVKDDNLPEISRLALSPNSKSIIFILQEDDNPGFLCRTSVPSRTRCEMLSKLSCPAADVIHITFPSNDDFYYVVRSAQHSRNYQITTYHASLRSKTIHSWVLTSGGADNARIVRMFTDLSIFNGDPHTCALITHETRLHIQSLSRDHQNPDQSRSRRPSFSSQYDIEKYRVLRIMASHKYRRMIAVGKPVASSRMVLLALDLPINLNPTGIIEAIELASIPDLSSEYAFKEQLCEEEDKTVILIATLAPGTQRGIHRITLPNSDF